MPVRLVQIDDDSMKKKRIAVIGLKGLPSFGGAARVGEGIVEELKDKYSFTIYATASHTDKEGDLGGYDQIVFRQFPVKKLNVFYYYLVSSIHALFHNYDLIHLHHVDGSFILPLLKIRFNVIGTSHGRPQLVDKWKSMKWYFEWMEKLFLRFTDTATAVAIPLQYTYQKMTEREVVHIPNGIHLNEVVDGSDIPHPDYLMFAAGRILPSKGCHTFLKALHQLAYSGKVLVVGDLTQISSYENDIRQLANGLDVTFVPLIREKSILLNYIKQAKLFVYPSYIEAMSIMMLEGACMRTPMICADIEENKAVFNESETLYFSPENVDDLAEKIRFAIDNPAAMEAYVSSAHEKLRSTYSWQSVAGQYAVQFETLIR